MVCALSDALACYHTPSLSLCVQVRQRNVLKDFVQVAGPLGVTHFMIVSRSDEFINLRVCRIPHGPTLTFHIKAVSGRGQSLHVVYCLPHTCVHDKFSLYFVFLFQFSLCKDVVNSQKDPVSTQLIYMTPPLVSHLAVYMYRAGAAS